MYHGNHKEAAGKSNTLLELLMILAAGILVYFLSYHYNFLEHIVHFTRKYESRQLDEILVVSIYFMIALAVYSYRRWREVQTAYAKLMHMNDQLQTALDEIKKLRGILPICSSCKKIRDDKGDWHEVELYIRDHSEAEFSHSLCPDCTSQIYSDFMTDAEEIGLGSPRLLPDDSDVLCPVSSRKIA